MVAPVKLNFKVIQGSTFTEVLRLESDEITYKPITGVTKSAPIVITAVGHSIPVGWRTKITNVGGMKELNSDENYHIVTSTTEDTVTINSINSLSYTSYTSGGVLAFHTPVDLSAYTARMQIRQKINSTDFVLELTTANGGIILDNASKTITINITDEDTAQFTFTTAVYSLELVKGSQVQSLITGTLTLDKEVTR